MNIAKEKDNNANKDEKIVKMKIAKDIEDDDDDEEVAYDIGTQMEFIVKGKLGDIKKEVDEEITESQDKKRRGRPAKNNNKRKPEDDKDAILPPEK